MCELNKHLEKNECNNYYADIVFNRNKKSIKQLPNDDDFLNNIFPDIIVHSRGKEILDNLLVLEMKKVVLITKIRKMIGIDLGR